MSATTNTVRKDRPLIGVIPSYQLNEETLSIPIRYMNAITHSGGAPLVLPFTMDTEVQETVLPTLDGFLLSGGQDIDPGRYGEVATSEKLSEFTPNREEVEYLVLNYAKKYNIPILGICRGMQAMNVSFGGTLYQDIDDQFICTHSQVGCTNKICEYKELCTTTSAETPTLTSSHCQIDCYHLPIHDVTITPGSQLYSILKQQRIAVNSMHHQAIKVLGNDLRACAHDPEGLVEAIEVPGLDFMVGVQWHPEFFAQSTMQPLFDAFVSAASLYRQRTNGHRPNLRIAREDHGQTFPDYIIDDVEASLSSACL